MSPTANKLLEQLSEQLKAEAIESEDTSDIEATIQHFVQVYNEVNGRLIDS